MRQRDGIPTPMTCGSVGRSESDIPDPMHIKHHHQSSTATSNQMTHSHLARKHRKIAGVGRESHPKGNGILLANILGNKCIKLSMNLARACNTHNTSGSSIDRPQSSQKWLSYQARCVGCRKTSHTCGLKQLPAQHTGPSSQQIQGSCMSQC